MKIISKTCVQWAAFIALYFIGGVAFMVLAGDEDPMNPMPFGRWILIKALAMVVIAICILGGKWLYKKGYLPEYIDTITEEE